MSSRINIIPANVHLCYNSRAGYNQTDFLPIPSVEDNEMTEAKPLVAEKQLKKNDFLIAVTEAPMTRGELVEALEGYKYIASYLDYLIDHFVSSGKIIKNEENGTIQRKGKKPAASGSRGIFKVVLNEETGLPEFEHKDTAAGEKLDKESGWAVTENRAVKNYCSKLFADTQAAIRAAKALVAVSIDDEPEAE